MSETRRELFKTSVITALGGLAAGALSGCVTDAGGQGPRLPPASAIAVHDVSGYWYFFVFKLSWQKCEVWKTGTPGIFLPFPNTDAYTWWAALLMQTPSEVKQITSNDSIQYQASDGSAAPPLNISFTTDPDTGDIILDGTSWSLVTGALRSSTATAGSWNEIGKT